MAFNNPKISAFAGAPLDIRFAKIIDGDAGGALDLTGKTLGFVIVQARLGGQSFDRAPLVTKTGPAADQIEVTSATGGACVVHLQGADTAPLSGLCRYQLTVIDGADASPVATGLIELTASLHS